MAKNEKFTIIKDRTGKIWLDFGDNSEHQIDTREMMKNEQYEAVKSEILKMGRFFSEKIEKYVRKELGYYV